MIKYVFKDDRAILKNGKKADPQKIGEAIAEIQAKHDGKLKPQYLWQEAQGNKRHALYSFFEWDVEKAAAAHWTDQARHIISMIREEPVDDEPPAPAFISINEKGVGTTYRAKAEVVDSRALQLIVLQNAERDLDAFQRRYHVLQDICEIVRQAKSRIEVKRSELETRAAA